jgi:predicted nucleic acid-binding protein
MGRLALLDAVVRTIGKLAVPESVCREIMQDRGAPGEREISSALHGGLLIATCVERSEELREGWLAILDQGEADVLSLAHQRRLRVLMDEKKGRMVAQRLGVPVVGTLGVLIRAKRLRIIKAVHPIIEQMVEHGYRISPPLIKETLRLAREKLR